MKRRIRVAAASSLLPLAALGLIACGGGDDETTTSVVTETVTVAQKPCGMYGRWTLVVQGDVSCAEARRVFGADVKQKPLPSDWDCVGPEGNVLCDKGPEPLFINATCCGAPDAAGLREQAMSEENVELVDRAYNAFNRRDLDAFLACMDPEVEFTTRFMQMENRAYDRGHSGIRDWWRDTFAVFPDYRAEILEVRDLGDAGIAALRMRGHGADSGAPFHERLWGALKLRNGKVIWWSIFASEAEALEAAGLSE